MPNLTGAARPRSTQDGIARAIADSRRFRQPMPPRDPSRYYLDPDPSGRAWRIKAWAERYVQLPRPAVPPELAAALDARDWPLAVELSNDPTRHTAITVGVEALLSERNVARWPRALVPFLASGTPGGERTRLCHILELFRDLGLRAFDSEDAQSEVDALPRQVAVFRGTSMREVRSGEWGVSWTTDSFQALGFAGTRPMPGAPTRHVRRGPGDSPGAMLFAEIDRDAIVAALKAEGLLEVLICPRDIAPHVQWIDAAEAERMELEAFPT